MNELLARTNLSTLQVRTDLLRTETLDGKLHLVAPVVCVVEGVHNGELVPYEEITVFPDAWNGIPLPIDHPQKDGEPITANSPEIIANSVIGRLFRVTGREDIKGISGEIWVDIEKAGTVPGGDEVLRKLQAGEPLEVSTAYNTFVDNIPGEFTNKYGEVEKYCGTQRQLRPDHLALLPYAVGACNWRDGCGAGRINTCTGKEGVHAVKSSTGDNSMTTEKAETLKALELKTNGKQLGLVLGAAIAANNTDAENGEIDAKVLSRMAAAAGIEPAKIADIVAGKVDFIPRQWMNIFASILDIDPYDLYSACSNDGYNLRYSVNKGTSENTEKTVITNISEKEPAENVSIPDTVTNESHKTCGPCEKTMTEKLKETVINVLKTLGIEKVESAVAKTDVNLEIEHMPEIKPTVDALIASNKNKFGESHREWLMTLNADQLSLFEVEEPKKDVDTKIAETKVVENTKVETATAPVQITAEMIYAALGIKSEDIALVRNTAEQVRTVRNAKIETIAAIEGCPYSKTELANLSDESLDKTIELLQPDTPFRVAVAARKSNSNTNTVPAPPAILLAAVEAK